MSASRAPCLPSFARADRDLDFCAAKILAISSTIVGIRLTTSVTTNSTQNCFSILFETQSQAAVDPFLEFFVENGWIIFQTDGICWFTIKIAPGDFDPRETWPTYASNTTSTSIP
jgi:hypothetical protein